MVSCQSDFLGVVPYRIWIFGVRFLFLVTFVILHLFSLSIEACGYFYDL